MKVPTKLIIAAAGVLALVGCASSAEGEGTSKPTASSSASAVPSSSAAPAAAETSEGTAPAGKEAASTAEKEHFTGDYRNTSKEDSDRINELGQQWYSPEKEADLREKLAAAGLESNIPTDPEIDWYQRAGNYCQFRFDGYDDQVSGVWKDIEDLAVDSFCPEFAA